MKYSQNSLKMDDRIVHYTHPQHDELVKVSSIDPFTCSACKEKGAGKRFCCQQCDFQLHEFCALSPRVLNSHPLHSQHQHLALHSKPKQGIVWPKCDICGKGIKGLTYRCGACNFHMHPCCAMLSYEMKFPQHPHLLKLLPHSYQASHHQQYSPAAGTGGEIISNITISSLCGECRRKRSGRMYQCTVCDYHLHAVCAKSIINGLKTDNINLSDEKPSMLGPAARVASQVVIEFIGGLIQGLGEAVGQALLQNISIMRSGGRRRNPPPARRQSDFQ